MKKVLIAYVSRTGKTEAMANYIAEGLRIGGQEVDVKKIAAIENEKGLIGYDGYVFGCPTYHKDVTSGMKQFPVQGGKSQLDGQNRWCLRFPHP
jgi:flavodoxin